MTTTNEMSDEFVEKIWTEIGSIQGKSKVDSLAKSFFKKQGDLAEYILAMTEDLGEEAHGLAFYLGIVIWSCYDRYFQGNLKKINDKTILKIHEKFESELDKLEFVDERFIEKRIKNKSDYTQPSILKYIVEALFENDDEELNLTSDQQGMIFIILSTQMKCLDQAALAKEDSK
ncbi:MAG: hypothetical protein AB7O96_16040 [Pseudobdellovibrionaceae bacterium]